MRRNFEELRAKMNQQTLKRVDLQADLVVLEILLSELRRLSGVTQGELAEKLGIKQPTLSRMESQDDMHISTLRRVVGALEGELEITVRLPTGDIRLRHLETSR